jgi:hypothetical protein
MLMYFGKNVIFGNAIETETACFATEKPRASKLILFPALLICLYGSSISRVKRLAGLVFPLNLTVKPLPFYLYECSLIPLSENKKACHNGEAILEDL